jgi:hypothetical protein
MAGRMRVFVVTKSPVDLPGASEFIGAFSTAEMANAAVLGAGVYRVAEMQMNRRYSGDLRDVKVIVKLASAQFKTGRLKT